MAEGKLSVVLYDLPPFSKLEGTKVTGVDGDILNAIAENGVPDNFGKIRSDGRKYPGRAGRPR